MFSIPDYSVTPFAQSMNGNKITKEIDEFNTINKELAIRHKLHYIDITPGTREAKNHPDLIASDGLHPSEKEYARWSEKLSEIIIKTASL